MNYAGFWRRFGAFWVDFVVMSPLIGIGYLGMENFRLFQVYWVIPCAVLGLWFSVYLVARYGGTPGKLMLKTKIVMDDGSPVTPKAALIRYSVLLALSLASSIGIAYASFLITDEQYFSLNYIEKSKALAELAPKWYHIAAMATEIWVWSEFITMLFNKRRKSIHDYMAGTTVVMQVPSSGNMEEERINHSSVNIA